MAAILSRPLCVNCMGGIDEAIWDGVSCSLVYDLYGYLRIPNVDPIQYTARF